MVSEGACVLLLWCHTGAAGDLRAPMATAPRSGDLPYVQADLPPAAGAVSAEREPVTVKFWWLTLAASVRVPRERLPAPQHGPGRAVDEAVRAAVGESEDVIAAHVDGAN